MKARKELVPKRRATSLYDKIREESIAARGFLSMHVLAYLSLLAVCVVIVANFWPLASFTYHRPFFPNGLNEYVEVLTYAREIILPSLNLNDYKERPVYPVFNSFPFGIKRSDMPQFSNSEPDVWDNFVKNIVDNGGSCSVENVDLRLAISLQSELSGFIIYNVLFGDQGERVKEMLASDHKWFQNRIVLIRTPSDVESIDGSIIKKNSLLILDGHHTTAVAQLCAQLPQSMLRLGRFNNEKKSCGAYFDPEQDVRVIEGLHPLVIRNLALGSGARNGFHMNQFNPSHSHETNKPLL